MSPIRVGIVGLSNAGWASTTIAPSLLSAPLSSLYTIAALSTTSPQSAQLAAEKYKARPYHGSTTNISSDPDVDLILVAVKAPDHKKALIPAIEKGKDVFVEWPLGNGLAEAKELAEMARTNGVRTMVGMQSWQAPEIRKIQEWIGEGKIGRVLSSTFVGTKPAELDIWAPVTRDRAAYCLHPDSGATFLDVIIGHNLSAITHALGPLSRLSASTAQLFPTVQIVDDASHKPVGEPIPSPAPDQYSISGILKDSGAILTATWCGGVPTSGEKNGNKNRPSFSWIIHGEEGWIKIENTGAASNLLHVYGAQKIWLNGELMDVKSQDGMNNVGRAFLQYTKGEKEGVYPTFEHAVLVHKYIEAVKRSSAEGRMIEVDSL